MKVSATELQNNFGKYLSIALEEDITITRNGKLVANLSAYDFDDECLHEPTEAYELDNRVTYEAFIKLTENSEERYELIDGEIYLLASPLYKHQVVVGELFGTLYNWFKGKPCRPLTSPFDVNLFDMELTFEEDPNVVQPDILVMCDAEKVNEKGKYKGTPTLVVEVLSKSTRSKDVIKKLNLYMKSGVKEYWIVDTDKEQVYIHTFKNGDLDDYSVYTGDMIIKSQTFEGLQIPLNELWQW